MVNLFMSNETADRFLLKLYEKTGHKEGLQSIDKYEIGEQIGLLDKIQTDHIVETLVKDGFVNWDLSDSEIRITEEGKKRISKSN